jgi:hypothetical protein
LRFFSLRQCFENALHLDGLIPEENDNRTNITFELEKNSGKRRRGSRTHYKLPPNASKKSRISSPGSNASARPFKKTYLLELLTMFQRLVRDTHFWPCSSLESASCVKDFTKNRRKSVVRHSLWNLCEVRFGASRVLRQRKRSCCKVLEHVERESAAGSLHPHHPCLRPLQARKELYSRLRNSP